MPTPASPLLYSLHRRTSQHVRWCSSPGCARCCVCVQLVDFVNRGGKDSPVDRMLFKEVAKAEAKSLPDWTQEHLEQLKSGR